MANIVNYIEKWEVEKIWYKNFNKGKHSFMWFEINSSR